MISKITGPAINPTLSKGDGVERPDEQKREKGQQRHKEEASSEEAHDDTLFSLDAIRALLMQENAEVSESIIADFALLELHGVTSIPIRGDQPILEAVAEAAARLR